MNQVHQNDDGTYEIRNHAGKLAGPFLTNSAAWRELDRIDRQNMSRLQERAEYAQGKSLGAQLREIVENLMPEQPPLPPRKERLAAKKKWRK